jgi:type VI secretion system protein ImpG
MDPRLLKYYNRELQHVRELGAEFARAYPKIAGRLGLEEFECADPYVERLLEGMAFLAARVQLKLDAQYPQFSQHLFEIVYPHFLAPTPSMTVVQMQPDLNEGALAEGVAVPRGTMLRGQIGKGEQTACRYQTAHDVSLWPLQITGADYFTREDPMPGIPDLSDSRAGLRIRLTCTAGLTFDQLTLERLPLFLRGSAQLAMGVYEQLLANTTAVIVRPVGASGKHTVISAREIRRCGFRDAEAMLPYGPQSFRGYRLLHEYFACPERFLFVELGGLGRAVKHCPTEELEIFLLFDRVNRVLEHRIDPSMFALFCTPAVNLFSKRADRIHLDDRHWELLVLPDRTRPLDYETYQITEVEGYGEQQKPQTFLPFYASFDRAATADRSAGSGERGKAFYTVHRVHRTLSEKENREGPRSSYVGSETYLSLVDAEEAPYRNDLRQLGLSLLCTNRDLPLMMPVGVGNTDLTPETSTPVQSIRCLVGPTRPRPALSYGTGETAWRLVNHLSLNYASLLDDPQRGGASALREMLSLYGDTAEPHIRKQIEGVLSVVTKPVTRPVQTDGPLTFARGLEVSLTCDESAFEGTSVFLLGAVLEEFLARYVSINSFTETVVQTENQGEIMRWPPRIGRRASL